MARFILKVEIADSDVDAAEQLAMSLLHVSDELICLDLAPGIEIYAGLLDVEKVDI